MNGEGSALLPSQLGGIMKNLLVTGMMAGLGLAAVQVEAAPVVVSTMPGVNDQTTVERTFADYTEYHGLAVGFVLPSAGVITHITADLTPDGLFSYGGSFIIGIASNALIGSQVSAVHQVPSGSLWETNVCSTEFPIRETRTGCDIASRYFPENSLVKLGAGQTFDVATNIATPSAGTYWLYTRFELDTVFANWTKNSSIQTDLVARRVGGALPAFFQVSSPQAAPGFSVSFDVSPVPEPASSALLMLGIAALLAKRRKTA